MPIANVGRPDDPVLIIPETEQRHWASRAFCYGCGHYHQRDDGPTDSYYALQCRTLTRPMGLHTQARHDADTLYHTTGDREFSPDLSEYLRTAARQLLCRADVIDECLATHR